MNFIKQAKKIALALAVFLITGPATADDFSQNLVKIIGMTPAQKAVAYGQYLDAAAAAVTAKDTDGVSENFIYAAQANPAQARIDIYNDPRFSYANMSKSFTEAELYDIGTILNLAPSKAEAYSQGTLIPTTPASPPTEYEMALATLQEEYNMDPSSINDVPEVLAELQSNLATLSPSDPSYSMIQANIKAAQDFMNSHSTQSPINMGGAGTSGLPPEELESIQQQNAYNSADISNYSQMGATAQKALAESIISQALSLKAAAAAGQDVAAEEAISEHNIEILAKTDPSVEIPEELLPK